MRGLSRQLSRVALGLGIVGGGWALAAQSGSEHPRLVSIESTSCTDCHGELIENKTSVHGPAAADCTTCHEMALGEAGTQVTLLEPEPALCLICHDELTAAVESDLEWPHFPVTDSCLYCHDPHASNHENLLAASVPTVCAECHDAEDLAEPHGGQLTATASCLRCHQPHGGDQAAMLRGKTLHAPFEEGSCDGCHRAPFGDRVRLRRRDEKLCTACHGDVLESVAGGSLHGAVIGKRGRAGCLSCHDPHMSDSRKLLLGAGGKLCRQCHGEIVESATAETGHAPAADDCSTCHEPHSSGEVGLLTMAPEELCVACHDSGDEDLVQAHLGADLGKLTCTQCHTPHGSGHEKLLARTLHWPVTDGCDSCHEGSFDQLAEGGGSALCVLCHDEIEEVAASAKVPHAALELGSCTDCHNPHASQQDWLLKLPGGGVCLECHDEKAPLEGESVHGIIELVGCQACHEPHGGDQAGLLRRTGNELCLSCHQPGAVQVEKGAETALLLDRFEVPVEGLRAMASLRLSADGQRNHPVFNHRVIGLPTASELKATDTTFEGELGCLSCHDPHKGRAALLRWGASSSFDACVQCHPK